MNRKSLLFVLLGAGALAADDARASACDWYQAGGLGENQSCLSMTTFQSTHLTYKDCKEARDSKFYKDHGCGPEEGGKDSLGGGFPLGGLCDGSSSCFGLGALTQATGLTQLGSLLGQMGKEAGRLHDIQGKRLTTAQSAITGWQKNLGGDESKRYGDVTGLQHDRNLVANATDAYNGKGKYEPAKGQHPLIDAALAQFSDARQGESEIQKEMEKVRQGMQALQQMKSATTGRNDNLGSLTDPQGGAQAAAAARAPGAESGKLGAKNGKDSDTDSSDITGKGNLNLAGGPKKGGLASGLSGKSAAELAGGGAGGADGAGETGDASLKARLRAVLDARNKQAARNADAIENGEFQTNLGGVVDVESRDKDGRQNALDDFVPGAASAAAERDKAIAAERAALGADPDPGTHRFGGARDLASVRADGVLGSDTSDLFQRVHQAHKHCLSRECVAMARKK